MNLAILEKHNKRTASQIAKMALAISDKQHKRTANQIAKTTLEISTKLMMEVSKLTLLPQIQNKVFQILPLKIQN